ncbi:MAG: hypothetical protein AB7E85_00765 [Pseudobdellovibrionaceae bacterium]
MNPLGMKKQLILAVGLTVLALGGGAKEASADGGQNCRTYKAIEYRWGVPYQVTHRECARPVRQQAVYPSGSWFNINFFDSPSYVVRRGYYPQRNVYVSDRRWDRKHDKHWDSRKKHHRGHD